MTEVKGDLRVPDRLSTEEGSPYKDPRFKNVEVLLDGKLRRGDVLEYCVSENWCRIWLRNSQGRFLYERGKPRAIKLHGKVEPFIRR